MNKGDLIKIIKDVNPSITEKAAKETLNALLDSIVEDVKKGNKVCITGFGTFEIKETASKSGRNPSTGESIIVPAAKRLRFKQSKAVKEILNK